MNKPELLAIIKNKISEKIQHLENLIAETRASSNDTKSSMGDKYETGREMLQQEINNLQRQLNEALLQQSAVQKISTDGCLKAQIGALIKTDRGLFYISASVGEIIYDNHKVMSVSSESPLAKAMSGMMVAEKFTLNNTTQTIENIW